MSGSRAPAPWQRLFEAKDWDRLDAYWRHAPEAEAGDIFEALQRVVGTKEIVNGVEVDTVYREPGDVAADLVGAAEILREGEVEVYATGEDAFLPPFVERWAELAQLVLDQCAELDALTEVTEGAASMSRRHHAQQVPREFDAINRILAAMLVADDHNPSDDPALQEHLATVAVKAFIAGEYFRAALGKKHESDAVRGERVAGGARNAAHATNERHEALRERRMASMTELIPKRAGKSRCVSLKVLEMPLPDNLTDPLLTAREVGELLTISLPSVFRRVAAGDLPKPIKLGTSSRWPQSEILAAKAARTTAN